VYFEVLYGATLTPPAKDISCLPPEMQWPVDTLGQLVMFDLPEQRRAPSGQAGRTSLPRRPKRHVPEQAELPIESEPDAVDKMLALGSTHAEIAAKSFERFCLTAASQRCLR
jgi:hypothetical protein